MQISNTKDIAAKHIKVLVHGAAGSGKTRLCSTTGGKPIILSAESGLLSLAGEDIDVVEIKTIQDLYEAFNFLKTDEKYDWVCLDSISEIAEVVLDAEKAKTKDPRQAYGELQTQMMQLLRGFRSLPKNIYFSAKQDRVKDEVTGGIISGPSAPGTKVGPAMPYLFDEVFALHSWKDDAGEIQRALQTQRCNQYEAKDRSGKLEFTEPADLAAIHAKIVGKKSEEKKGK